MPRRSESKSRDEGEQLHDELTSPARDSAAARRSRRKESVAPATSSPSKVNGTAAMPAQAPPGRHLRGVIPPKKRRSGWGGASLDYIENINTRLAVSTGAFMLDPWERIVFATVSTTIFLSIIYGIMTSHSMWSARLPSMPRWEELEDLKDSAWATGTGVMAHVRATLAQVVAGGNNNANQPSA